MTVPVLQVEGLRTEFLTRNTTVTAVDGVSLSIAAGELVGLVGESGCGKTTLGLSVLRLVPEPGRITAGSIAVQGRDLLAMDEHEVHQVRGAEIAITFQDAMTALNPLLNVGTQMKESMTAGRRHTAKQAAERLVPLMRAVSIPGGRSRARDYPHQFSGGMLQRVLIAMGVANHPALLVADEATTGLDTTIQAQIIDLLERLNDTLGTAVLLITHDLSLVARLCRRVVVMYAGRIVEDGPAEQVLLNPRHPYTWSLLQAVPRIDAPPRRRLASIAGSSPVEPSVGCTFEPRCRLREAICRESEPPLGEVTSGHHVRCWMPIEVAEDGSCRTEVEDRGEGHAAEPVSDDAHVPGEGPPLLQVDRLYKHFLTPDREHPVRAVDGVSLEIRRGETLGLIGESGCGKSTLARVITRLLPATSGRVLLDGQNLMEVQGKSLRRLRPRFQIMLQDPLSSLDGRMTVARSIAEPLENVAVEGDELRRKVSSLLEEVALEEALGNRYPHELSGGQRQRVVIARALAIQPDLIVCDEPVSSLDVSVQAQIINLMKDLQAEHRLAYLLITHDLAVVRHMAHRVAVMYLGRIVEAGAADQVFAAPQHPYTQALLASVPSPDPRRARLAELVRLGGEVPSAANPPKGCRFHPRCPVGLVPGICSEAEPALDLHGAPGQQAACHLAGPPLPVPFYGCSSIEPPA